MSKTRMYKGTLTKIQGLEGLTLEEKCKDIVDKLDPDKEFLNSYDTYKETLVEEYYKDYYIYGNDIYKIDSKELYPDSDIFEGTRVDESTIKFHTMFYDGGCNLSEALDEVMSNLE